MNTVNKRSPALWKSIFLARAQFASIHVYKSVSTFNWLVISVFLSGEALFLLSWLKRAHYVFVVRAWEHSCFSEHISGFCVATEAVIFLNSSFKLEPATLVLHWETKFLHISCARGRSVGRTKVGIVCHKDVITVSPEPGECWGDMMRVSPGHRSFPSGMWE